MMQEELVKKTKLRNLALTSEEVVRLVRLSERLKIPLDELIVKVARAGADDYLEKRLKQK
ncbi:MAG: hypothetical protein KGH74_05515 [Candidatus Micrarchaeota archaeon]|nr:hypothetical protein [Candidatus Micrarchaeota archaeon]